MPSGSSTRRRVGFVVCVPYHKVYHLYIVHCFLCPCPVPVLRLFRGFNSFNGDPDVHSNRWFWRSGSTAPGELNKVIESIGNSLNDVETLCGQVENCEVEVRGGQSGARAKTSPVNNQKILRDRGQCALRFQPMCVF